MRYPGFSVSSMLFLLINLSIYLPYVLGHGFVANVTVNGKVYPGWNPDYDPQTNPERIVRRVPNDGHVSPDDEDIACHKGGNDGTPILANAPDGSKITFQRVRWPCDHKGPVSTYMTLCEPGCAKFKANSASWFKIDATGYTPNSAKVITACPPIENDPDKGLWASISLIEDHLSWTSTIPAGLKPGEYLVRHEIIALHSAGKPQFYPSCAQVNVTGTGKHFPPPKSMVTMPDLYNTKNKKFKFPDIWSQSYTFTFPDPPAVNFGENAPSPPRTKTNSTKSQPSPSSSTRQPQPTKSQPSSSTRQPNSARGSKLRRRKWA